MTGIDDLSPLQRSPLAPRLAHNVAGRIVLTVHDDRGRMIRLELTPDQVGRLAGDLARMVLGAPFVA